MAASVVSGPAVPSPAAGGGVEGGAGGSDGADGVGGAPASSPGSGPPGPRGPYAAARNPSCEPTPASERIESEGYPGAQAVPCIQSALHTLSLGCLSLRIGSWIPF